MVIANTAYLFYGSIASSATAARAELAGSGASVPGEYALNTAQLIAMLPHSVFVLSVATVLFNRLSHQHSAGAVDDVRNTVSSGLRTIGIASVFGAAAVVVLAGPLARLFAGSGPTAAASAASMGQVALAIVSAGMPFMSIYFFLGRVFYAEEDAKTPLIMQALCSGASVLLAVLIAWLVDPTMVVYALALLFAVFHVVSAVLAHHSPGDGWDYGAGTRRGPTFASATRPWAPVLGAAVLWLFGGYATGGSLTVHRHRNGDDRRRRTGDGRGLPAAAARSARPGVGRIS